MHPQESKNAPDYSGVFIGALVIFLAPILTSFLIHIASDRPFKVTEPLWWLILNAVSCSIAAANIREKNFKLCIATIVLSSISFIGIIIIMSKKAFM